MENFANNVSTSLEAAITSATATTITVESWTGFPVPNFRVIIDSEIMLVTSIGSSPYNTWTVTRGADGTLAGTHAQFAGVVHVLTAGSLNDIVCVQQAGVETSNRRILNFTGGISSGPIADDATNTRTIITLNPDAKLVYPYGNLSYGTPGLASGKQVSLAAGATMTLLDTTGGSSSPGFIDQIWLGIQVPTGTGTTGRDNSILSIYKDGESSPSFACPTAQLFAFSYAPAGFATRYLGCSTLSANYNGTGYIAHKIPWSSYIKVTLTNGDTSHAASIWYNVSYKTGSNINWGQAAHLYCTYNTGLDSGQSVTAYSTTTLANISGSGIFYGLLMYFNGGDSNLYYLEGAFNIYLNGSSTPSMTWSGTEDYFLSNDYFEPGTLCADNAGCTTKDSNEQCSAYRFHIDDPIPFTTGFKMTWTAGNSTYHPVSANVNIQWCLLYYLDV